ncbi:MAG: hypothetical protein IJ370_04075 [Oscillospiraceae bacterium]|nr:hypothetical protein [Oscillospiraceae bacterium]MBQ8338537.1 hypothetical protein [Oscillospiraceae bacterium]
MQNLTVIIIMAILIEAVITYVKTWVVDKKLQWQALMSVVLGVLVSVVYNLDIPAAVGITCGVPFVGCVITGILISRGSNYIFDLIKKIAPTEKTTQI